MVQYKLYYFTFRGLAESARMMFHMANIPFEDIRIPFESLKEHKEVTPFDKLPVLEIDGQKLPQSLAINRYIARKIGLAGKSDYEVALADAISEQFTDYFWEWRPTRMLNWPYGDADEETKEKSRQEVFIPASEKFFGYMANYLKQSKTGFLAGGELTYVDLMLADMVNSFSKLVPEAYAKFPDLEEHRKKVFAIPGLQKWLKERPESPF